MTEDFESRIKALEEKLTPSPDKMSTMKASNRLKQMLDSKKGEKESQEDVVWRLNDQAEKVPELEKELQKTKAEATNYRNLVIVYDKSLQDTYKECEDLKKENSELLAAKWELEKK